MPCPVSRATNAPAGNSIFAFAANKPYIDCSQIRLRGLRGCGTRRGGKDMHSDRCGEPVIDSQFVFVVLLLLPRKISVRSVTEMTCLMSCNLLERLGSGLFVQMSDRSVRSPILPSLRSSLNPTYTALAAAWLTITNPSPYYLQSESCSTWVALLYRSF